MQDGFHNARDMNLEANAEVASVVHAVHNQEARLLEKANVEGVGVGFKNDTNRLCIKVLVSHKLDKDLLAPGDLVESELEGVVTDVEAVGTLFAGGPAESLMGTPVLEPRRSRAVLEMPADSAAPPPELTLPKGNHLSERMETDRQVLRGRLRPAEGGYSVGHYNITAGTIATTVYDATPYPGIPRRFYILSNNHVLANSNNARVGDPILQPGPYDGGSYPGDVIARLSRWVPINFLPSTHPNYVDAAVAEGPFEWLDREVYWIGYIKGVRNNWPAINEVLQKTGRTTNYTTGRTIAIDATVNVNYGGGGVAQFRRQIVTTNMSAGGDSGSIVCDLDGNAIGLLFAGSSTATIINHIYYVQSLLDIRIV